MARKSGSSDKAGAGAGKGPKASVAAGKTVANLVVKMGAQPEAQTIVYIHGIGNKPPPATLKCQWDNALFGVELGDRSRLAYWVHREFYPTPTADTCTGDDVVRVDDDQMTTKAVLILSKQPEVDDKAALDAEIAGLSANEDERKLLRAIAGKMGTPVPDQQHAYGVLDLEAKILPLPAFMRRIVTQVTTRAFLRDVHEFFFNEQRRNAMEGSLLDRLCRGRRPIRRDRP
jgi:hypothetical protein